MQINKLIDTSNEVVPFIASLPYSISVEKEFPNSPASYDPVSQRTINAGSNSSRCREEDSVTTWMTTKSDTKKDD